jgi:Uma2 family endonuclease
MVDVGILSSDSRTELIDGEIIEMSPMGARHAAVVTRVNDLLVSMIKGKALLRPQLPLRLNDLNEPQPDVVLLEPRQDCYASGHPRPTDVFLVIEIAASSLKYDRDVKLPIYASAGIPEVWIADLRANVVHVYREPFGKSYAVSLKLNRGQQLSCVGLPAVRLTVDDVLG